MAHHEAAFVDRAVGRLCPGGAGYAPRHHHPHGARQPAAMRPSTTSASDQPSVGGGALHCGTLAGRRGLPGACGGHTPSVSNAVTRPS